MLHTHVPSNQPHQSWRCQCSVIADQCNQCPVLPHPNNVLGATTHGCCLLGLICLASLMAEARTARCIPFYFVIYKGSVLSTARHAQGHKLREKVNKNGIYLDYHFAQDCVPCYLLTSVSLNLPVALPKCCAKGQVTNNSTKPHSLLSVSQEREMDCE